MKFIKKFLANLRFYLLSDVLGNLHKLERWQWLDKDGSTAMQQQRIKNLLLHAYYHVPYYQEVLKRSGVIDSAGAVDLNSFGQIPLLEKDTIRKRFEDLKSDDLIQRKWYKNSSGGSTGEPVTLIQDKEFNEWVKAIKMLNDIWSGYSISEKKIKFWGSERDIFVGRETSKTMIIRWLMNLTWLNAFRMTPEDMLGFVHKINALKPIQILAYVESIYELSRFIEREGLRIHSPRAIMTSAGPLFPHIRETVERVFQAPVFNRYGSREVGDIACECEQHSGLHVCIPTHYLEVLRADGSPANTGEIGEIVITCLHNYAMPLIRYRIGDMGILANRPCACGRNWPLLKEVSGRVTDVFLKNDGSQVHGEYFTHLFYFHDWIKKFQVIQEDLQGIRVKIVPREWGDNFHHSYAREIKTINEKILLVMGQESRVNFEFVEDIPPTPSGKYRYTISKIDK